MPLHAEVDLPRITDMANKRRRVSSRLMAEVKFAVFRIVAQRFCPNEL